MELTSGLEGDQDTDKVDAVIVDVPLVLASTDRHATGFCRHFVAACVINDAHPCILDRDFVIISHTCTISCYALHATLFSIRWPEDGLLFSNRRGRTFACVLLFTAVSADNVALTRYLE